MKEGKSTSTNQGLIRGDATSDIKGALDETDVSVGRGDPREGHT